MRAIRIRRRPHVPPCHHHHLPRVQTRAGGGSFQLFQRVRHHHHLPRVQTRAGGGFFGRSNASATTTTSLASQRELEVVFFGCFNASTTTTSLASKCEPEVDLWGVSTSGVSFPRYQQRRGGVKPTHRPVQMFSLPFGAPGTACNFVPCLPPPNDNEGWPPSQGGVSPLFAFLYPSGALSYT